MIRSKGLWRSGSPSFAHTGFRFTQNLVPISHLIRPVSHLITSYQQRKFRIELYTVCRRLHQPHAHHRSLIQMRWTHLGTSSRYHVASNANHNQCATTTLNRYSLPTVRQQSSVSVLQVFVYRRPLSALHEAPNRIPVTNCVLRYMRLRPEIYFCYQKSIIFCHRSFGCRPPPCLVWHPLLPVLISDVHAYRISLPPPAV